MNTLLVELVFIVILSILNIVIEIYFSNLRTMYSKHEVRWTQRTINLLILYFTGFTVFRGITIDTNASDRSFLVKCSFLMIYDIFCVIYFIMMQIEALKLDYYTRKVVGYQTGTLNPESIFIHLLRVFV